MVPKALYLLFTLALNGFTRAASSAPCRQAGPSWSAGSCTLILSRRHFRPRPAGFACLQTLLGPVSKLALGSWVRKRSTAHTLPSLSKPKFFAIPTSPVLQLVFPFLWVFALCGKQVFLCGSHFFCTGVSGGWFSGSPVWCLLPFFLNLCKRLWPPSSPWMPEGCQPSS